MSSKETTQPLPLPKAKLEASGEVIKGPLTLAREAMARGETLTEPMKAALKAASEAADKTE